MHTYVCLKFVFNCCYFFFFKNYYEYFYYKYERSNNTIIAFIINLSLFAYFDQMNNIYLQFYKSNGFALTEKFSFYGSVENHLEFSNFVRLNKIDADF